MWESIVLTVAATAGNNIGKILQKKGTVILPPLSLKLKVIRAYAFNKIWVIGFLMDIGGALLMLRALSLAPVSVIQPVSGVGLAILSIFSHFYLKEIMNAVDWVGIALAGVGTIGVGAGGEEQEAATLSIFHIPCLAFVVAILFLYRYCLMEGLEYAGVIEENKRCYIQMEYDVVEEIIYGLESGILFGMSSVISKMGFLFLEQGFHQLLVPLCIIFSVCCSGTGFYYQTRGLKHGRAIVVSTCAAVASIVSGVLAGMLALGERLPSAPKARLALLLGWLLIITGVILLVGSTRLVKFLSCSSGRTKRSNADKSYSARRPSSLRIREPNPSAVIPATTLNHLLPSASKEKA
ncbi:probable magnesium transporter NIPA9 isoform X3 [Arachis ipaensis]|uniref:probable magnesium transporter NIPA9 isoform X3 n=1 Tax=Arachis ipaensis TaxID=130454 RepID=UPI000A2B22FE|nr:probable magnesium transporter NIPA9 isoform X3 [Arachis ipaensis]XP_025660003.1 probable magnesium transporter NIPA9 isoform X1 [Arachis hypogaea]